MALIEESGKYMLGLVNGALNYQDIEAGKIAINRQIYYCRDIYNSLLAVLTPLARRKRINLQLINDGVNLDGFVYTDDARVKQIILSIVGNAIKFTPEGGIVELKIERVGTRGDIIDSRITVTDNGSGIGADFLKNKLFRPFEQEHAGMTAESAGSGLGLAISKQLIDRLGGTISLESKQGVGTKVIIMLPLQKASEEEAKKAGAEKADYIAQAKTAFEGKRFLLCEDHPINVIVTKKLIENAGGIMDSALNGAIGLKMFAESPTNFYDIILMDIHMPEMDGLECTRAIRRLTRQDSKLIPIIALTANAYEADIKETRDAGMNAHLTKPIEPKVFYDTIAKAILSQTSDFWIGRTVK